MRCATRAAGGRRCRSSAHPADLENAAETQRDRIQPAGALWIAWPRKAAGHASEVTENLIRDIALPTGLVDVKVAAIDDDWSGLKLVWRRELTLNDMTRPPTTWRCRC